MDRPGIDPLLTVDQAAAVLRTGPGYVRRLMSQRRIRFVRLGRQLRIPQQALADFIAAATVEPLGVPAPRRVE